VKIMDKIMKAKITKIIPVGKKIKIFYLKWDKIKEFEFKPGQFVNLSSEKFLDKNKEPIIRAYSIANSETEKNELELCITKQKNFSKYLCEEIKEGDIINLEGPYGNFTIEKTSQNITFIAGGTGIAPIIGFIRTLEEKKFDKEYWLFYSVREKEDLAYLEELEEYSKKNPKFHLIPSCTGDCIDWTGKKGRITEFINEYINETNKEREFYICGPPAMIEAITKKLKTTGIKEEKIHSERWQ
jgi:Na+-transporting NADH:ubiquinone oxidoreductase subunit F